MTDATSASPPPAPMPAASPQGLGPVGKVRNPWAVIGLSIITLGIYFLFWTYFVFQELKDRTGQGVGGVVGLLIGIFIGIVNAFLLPSEVGNMYARNGKPRPVSGVTGFWLLLPLIGFFIWVIKVQGAMNREWQGAAA